MGCSFVDKPDPLVYNWVNPEPVSGSASIDVLSGQGEAQIVPSPDRRCGWLRTAADQARELESEAACLQTGVDPVGIRGRR